MFKMPVLLSSLVATAVATAASGQQGTASLFDFFGGRDIDYWGEGRRVSGPATPAQAGAKPAPAGPAPYSGSSVVRAGDAKPFSWNSYHDPRTPEFWDDGGDWIPPRPFREAAAEPSPKNVSEYLAWQAKKTEVVGRFQQALTQGAALVLPQRPQPRRAGPSPSAAPAAAPTADIPWHALKLAYFYQSACPHCRASKDAVEEARRLGVQVLFVQLDHGVSPPLHTPSVPYDQEWDETFHIASTPTWVLSLNGKTVKHTGAMSLADLRYVASTLVN